MRLTGYGGVGEIGGNAFLLDDGKTRMMLDIGRRFGAAAVEEKWDTAFRRRPGFGDYFDAFLKARSFAAARDLLSLDVIPNIPALYRPDLGGTPGPAPVDAVLVSHAHQDHFGLLGLVRHDVPVLTSSETVETLSSLEATGLGGWETDLIEVRLRGGVQRKKDGELTTDWKYQNATKNHPAEEGPRRTFATAARTVVGDWTVERHAVDHSIQGAAGFVLERNDGFRIVYTGDFREHGRNPDLTRRFLKAARDADVLLMEGTNVHPPKEEGKDKATTDCEADVEEEVVRLVTEREKQPGAGFVGIGYPIRDLDRLVSLWRAAKRLGRRLVVQPKQAHLLATLRKAGRDDLPDALRDSNMAVYVKAQEKGTVLRRGAPLMVGNKATLAVEWLAASPDQWARLVTSELGTWERELLGAQDGIVPLGSNVVTPLDVAAAPRDFLFTLSYWNMTDLFDIFPEREKASGLYIHSQTQPFNDDLELTTFKLKRWLAAFHLGKVDEELARTHVSGHAGQASLWRMLDEANPRLLVPVHSEHPEMSAEAYSAKIGRTARVPTAFEPIQLAP